ncbi:MAG: hypothetical protein GEV09_05515 [Pseudonocardiaceae bacterium]|nr:hypothetical protein [Pseudonocardiaceae bacterium]
MTSPQKGAWMLGLGILTVGVIASVLAGSWKIALVTALVAVFLVTMIETIERTSAGHRPSAGSPTDPARRRAGRPPSAASRERTRPQRPSSPGPG